ncbi:hypothetical protein D9M71_520490 [compost metagenome]
MKDASAVVAVTTVLTIVIIIVAIMPVVVAMITVAVTPAIVVVMVAMAIAPCGQQDNSNQRKACKTGHHDIGSLIRKGLRHTI